MLKMSLAQLLIILTICFIAGQALICPTCIGSDCKKPDVPLVECNRHIPELPFGYLKSDPENANFACLDLEYKTGKQRILVRKCHLVNPNDDLCADIESSLPPAVKLRNCDFELNDVELTTEEVSEVTANTSQSTDDDTTITDDDSTTYEPTTEKGASNTAFLSLTLLTIAGLFQRIV